MILCLLLNIIPIYKFSLNTMVFLKETQMTSVLCELGFITNASEQDKLMSESYLKKAAKAMADGIVEFLK